MTLLMLIKLQLTSVRENLISGYKLKPFLDMQKLVSRSLRKMCEETLLLVQPTAMERCGDLAKIHDSINEFVSNKMMACRSDIVVLHSGKMTPGNPYAMADVTMIPLGRPLLPPSVLCQKVCDNRIIEHELAYYFFVICYQLLLIYRFQKLFQARHPIP